MKLFYTLLLLFSISLLSCRSGRNFTSTDPQLYQVKTIAILPVRVSYTGNLPKNLTQSTIDSLSKNEGYTFQQLLQANLLHKLGRRNRIPGISFQPIPKTNSILSSHSYSTAQIFAADPDSLAKLLGVDAVLKMEVNTNRIMSDLASLGIGVLSDVLNRNQVTAGTLNGANKTADIAANCSLMSKGILLWNSSYNRPADWQWGPRQVMNQVTRAMSRNFPY